MCYFLVIAGGVFAELFVREPFFVSGDAAATTRSIVTDESSGAGESQSTPSSCSLAPFAVILYRLFKPVHATLALLALVFAIAPVAIEALLLTALHVPLVMIGESPALTALDEGHRQALGYLAVHLFFTGWGFISCSSRASAHSSSFSSWLPSLVPRVIGALMIAAGVGYFLNSLSAILSPAVNAALLPWVFLPSFVGEFSLALWLTIRGVNAADRALP